MAIIFLPVQNIIFSTVFALCCQKCYHRFLPMTTVKLCRKGLFENNEVMQDIERNSYSYRNHNRFLVNSCILRESNSAKENKICETSDNISNLNELTIKKQIFKKLPAVLAEEFATA